MFPEFKLGGKQLNVEKVNFRYQVHYNKIRLVQPARDFYDPAEAEASLTDMDK